MKAKLIYFSKIGVTLGLLAYFLTKVNLRDSYVAIKAADPKLFLFAIVITVISWYLAAIRWSAVLGLMQTQASASQLFRINLIGTFYSMVLPGGKLAGDAMSAHRFTKYQSQGGYSKKYFLSVVMDRFFGMLGIFIFLGFYLLARRSGVSALGRQEWLVGLITVTLAGLGLLAIFSNTLDLLMLWVTKLPIRALQKLREPIRDGLQKIRQKKSKLWGLLGITGVSMFFSILSVYIVNLAVGLNASFEIIAFAYSLSTIFIVIPITLAGIGLREGTIVYILTKVGFETPKSVALAFLGIGLLFIFAATGGLLELMGIIRLGGKNHDSHNQIQA